MNTHEFALYLDPTSGDLNPKLMGTLYIIDDADLVHRIRTVLRLSVGDMFILFNERYHASCVISALELKKKHVSVRVRSCEENNVLQPPITFLLPLLKREALEAAVYSLSELGVTNIQPIVTRKSQKTKHAQFPKRMKKIIIAAAEQSKQFVLPDLKPIKTLDAIITAVASYDEPKLFFDSLGRPIAEMIASLRDHSITHLWCMVGPEGDLTQDEKQTLHEAGFSVCALTKSILRSSQAVAISTGILRSFL